MKVDEVLAQATERTGLDDFGAESFRDGLDRLVDSLNTEGDLSDLGEVAMSEQVIGALVNRLRVVDAHTQDPALRGAPVERPLIVLGLPRTGTTHLSYLLDCDPANRSLMRWEANDSLPPPRTETFDTDPRIEATRVGQEMFNSLNPEFESMHYEAPDGPTECVTIMGQDFKSLMWSTVAHVPTYNEWLLDADHGPTMDYHRLVLQVLQSQAPGRWCLKTPHYPLILDSLFAVYPDAQLVWTHRDPVTVTASTCSLQRSLSGTFTDVDHGETINAQWLQTLPTCVERGMAYRDAHPEVAVCDVAYRELVSDPLGTVQRIYSTFGEELSGETVERIEGYAAANPRGARGRHAYDAESLGLDVDAVRERFADYTERFGEYLD